MDMKHQEWFNNGFQGNKPNIDIYFDLLQDISHDSFYCVNTERHVFLCMSEEKYKVVPPPPQLCLLVYNPNNYRYNPLINPIYSTYKPT